MNYDIIVLACEQLNYRDKLRLAQLLIQMARKEEENANPQSRVEQKVEQPKVKEELKEPDVINYVLGRLLKSKPTKKQSLLNFIKAMFQFQGGIADADLNDIIFKLEKRKHIKIDQNNVSYL